MSNTNELPKEIYLTEHEIKRVSYTRGFKKNQAEIHKTGKHTAYILKSFHESEMERVKGEMQKEIDLLKSVTFLPLTFNNVYAGKTCDCKLMLGGTATHQCHGQCKY